ncbi:putative DMT superfamily transporter inner membrane protein [compost metagenome]
MCAMAKMTMKMNSTKAELLMVSVSLAWGSSYLLMKVGLNGIEPFSLIALRFGIAFFCMALIFLPRFRDLTPVVLGKGILMGVLLFLLFTGLVFGVNHTTASTAGFLASTTVIIIPILESFLKQRLPSKSIMFCILFVIVGLFLLTVKDTLAIDKGAALCLLRLYFMQYILLYWIE